MSRLYLLRDIQLYPEYKSIRVIINILANLSINSSTISDRVIS